MMSMMVPQSAKVSLSSVMSSGILMSSLRLLIYREIVVSTGEATAMLRVSLSYVESAAIVSCLLIVPRSFVRSAMYERCAGRWLAVFDGHCELVLR